MWKRAQSLLAHIAARWDIEVLFGDGKEELGLDHYQLMSATAIVRFWTLAMLAYVFLEQERTACKSSGNALSPLEKLAVKSSVAIVDTSSTGCMTNSFPALNLRPCLTFLPPEAALPKSANIERSFAYGLIERNLRALWSRGEAG